MFNPRAARAAIIAQEVASTISIHVAFPGACVDIEAERQSQLAVLDEASAEAAASTMKQTHTALTNNQCQHLIHVLPKEEIGSSGKLRFGCVQKVSGVFDINHKIC